MLQNFYKKCSGTLGLQLLQLYVIARLKRLKPWASGSCRWKYDGRTFVFYTFIFFLNTSHAKEKCMRPERAGIADLFYDVAMDCDCRSVPGVYDVTIASSILSKQSGYR